MKTKRKVAEIHELAEDLTAVEPANRVIPVSAAAIPNSGRCSNPKRNKATDNVVPVQSSVSTSSSDSDQDALQHSACLTQKFTGLGKKHRKTKKPKKPKHRGEHEELLTQPKKRRNKRPEHWRQIAEYYKNNSLEATLIEFHDDLGNLNIQAQYHKLHTRKKELENDIDKPLRRVPSYGMETERKLLDVVMGLLNAGNPVDDATLRGVLVDILTNEGRAGLLIENGGSCVFQTSWAARFWTKQDAAVKELRLKNHSVTPTDAVKRNKKSRAAEGGVSSGSSGTTTSPAVSMHALEKHWPRRPTNWIQIAQYFAEHGVSNTIATFPNELGNHSYSTAYKKLNTWRKDAGDTTVRRVGKPPVYGEQIDHQLLSIVQDRLRA